MGCLWAEILTAIVWWKSVKSWQPPIFCRRQYLWRFLHGRPVQRESAHKSRAASGNITLGDCTWRAQRLPGGEHQRGLGEVSCCGLWWAKMVRRCFRACANILSTPTFCWRQHFVDMSILSTQTFCRCEHFFYANIWSTPIFCTRQYSFLPPMFCCRQYFVVANILSVFRFKGSG